PVGRVQRAWARPESHKSPASAREPRSRGAEVRPPTGEQPLETVAEQVASPPETTKSPVGGTAKTTTARATSDPRLRTPTQARSTEQAERDAIATRRLIARELADSPQADSDGNALQ